VNLKNKVFSWGIVRSGAPQGSIMGPLLFLIYVNALPKIAFNTNHNNYTKIVLNADNTSVIVNNLSLADFERDINVVFKNMNEWFSTDLLSLNFSKTHFMQFVTKKWLINEINFEYNDKLISDTRNLKFLGIIMDSTLSGKNHINMIAPKLSQVCYIELNHICRMSLR
jgi:hypothetical protein